MRFFLIFEDFLFFFCAFTLIESKNFILEFFLNRTFHTHPPHTPAYDMSHQLPTFSLLSLIEVFSSIIFRVRLFHKTNSNFLLALSFFSHKFLIFLKASCQSTRWHFRDEGGRGREQDENHRLNFNFYLAAMELQCAVHSHGEFRSEANRQLLWSKFRMFISPRNYSRTKTCHECDGLRFIKVLKFLLRSVAGSEADERLATGNRVRECRRHTTASSSDD